MLSKIRKIVGDKVKVSEYFGLFEVTSDDWEDLECAITKVCDELELVEVLNRTDVVILGRDELALKVLGLS